MYKQSLPPYIGLDKWKCDSLAGCYNTPVNMTITQFIYIHYNRVEYRCKSHSYVGSAFHRKTTIKIGL